MKPITLATIISVLFHFSHLFAQKDTTSLQGYWDTAYSHLDTTALSTNFLYDKAVHFSHFDQLDTLQDSVISPNDWYQTYLELTNMQAKGAKIISMDSIDTLVTHYKALNYNPLLILNYSYDKISPNAFTNNLLDSTATPDSTQLYVKDVPGRTQNPYTQGIVFVACPAFQCMGSSSTVNFYLSSSLYFSNKTSPPTQVQVDFGDGTGYRTASWNSTITVSYSPDIPYSIHVKLLYGPSVFVSKAVYREAKMDGDIFDIRSTITADIGYSDPDIPITPNQKNQGIFTIAFGSDGGVKHTCLKRPVIFVEGIDYGYQTAPTGCKDGKCGNIGWIDLKAGLDHDMEKGQVVDDYDFLHYAPNMIQRLNDAGYDVIYLDFTDGADYMQRNAFVLVKLIQQVNAMKCGAEENIVIGASMGGQVSRYALSYMEKNNLHHCCKLYISFDSPNQGATVPIGDQLCLSFLARADNNAKDALNQKLYRQATEQLLKNALADYWGIGAQRIKSRWWSELGALGYYPSIRKIAIANSSANAISYGPPAGNFLLQAVAYLGAVRLNVNSDCGQYYCANVLATKCANWIFTGKLPFHGHVEYAPPSGCQLLDQAPGSSKNVTDVVAGPLKKKLGSSNVSEYEPNSCFIPTISALDINTTNLTYNIGLNIANFDNVSSAISPFKAIWTASSNQEHVFISEDMVNWALDQLSLVSNNLTASLPNTNGTTYNYGNGYSLLQSMDINNTGTLKINNDAGTSYGAGPMPNPGNFTVKISECASATVNVYNGGSIIVGDPTDASYTGTLELSPGSVLNLTNGSVLTVYNNSKVIIDKGANIIFRQGATINLIGSNAVLEIRGTLNVDDNTTFTLSGSSTGFIRFYQEYPTVVNAISGTNSSIFLSRGGGGIGNKVLEVAGGESFYPDDNFASVTFENARIELANNCRLNIGCPLTISNVKITSTADGSGNFVYNAHRGLNLYGQAHTVSGVTSSSVNVSDLEIDNGLYGIYGSLYYGGTGINLYNTKIIGCAIGLCTEGGSVLISKSGAGNYSVISDFSDVGWEATGLTGNSAVVNTDIYHSSNPYTGTANGIEIFGNTNGVSFLAQQSQVKRCEYGIIYSNGTITVNTCKITNNLDGIDGANLSINLNTSNANPGGHTDFSNNSEAALYIADAISSSDHSSFDLDNGYNNFTGCGVEMTGSVNSSACADISYNANYNTWKSGSAPPTNGFLMLQCPTTGIYYYSKPVDNNYQSTFNSSYYTGPTLEPVSIGNSKPAEDEFAGLVSSDNPGLKISINNAVQYLNEQDYHQAIMSFDKILRTYFISNKHDDELEYKLYLKTIYAAEQAYQLKDEYVTDLLQEVIDLQEAIAIDSKSNYRILSNVTKDKAGLYRLLNRYDEALTTLSEMKNWLSEDDLQDVEYRFCYMAAEDSVKKGITKREDFARLVAPCVSPQKLKIIHQLFQTANNTVAPGNMLLYPNPASGSINLVYNASEEGSMSFTIMSADGRLMDQKLNNSFSRGNNTYTISTGAFVPGVYFVSANVNGKEYRQKFVVTR